MVSGPELNLAVTQMISDMLTGDSASGPAELDDFEVDDSRMSSGELVIVVRRLEDFDHTFNPPVEMVIHVNGPWNGFLESR